MIAVFAAMQMELAGFLRRLDVHDRTRVEGFPVAVGEYAGRPLLVCHTGIGRRAGEAAAAVMRRYAPRAALSVGLGGALSPECRVGDLVFCEWVRLAESEAAGVEGDVSVQSDAGLLELARRGARRQGLRHWIGGSLTVGRVVSEREQKAALWRVSGLDVVEMESYWVGRAVREAGAPFLAARAISDQADERLPEIADGIGQEGELRMGRVLLFALSQPAQLPVLLRTAASGRRAVANLTRFLEAFVGALETSQAGKHA